MRNPLTQQVNFYIGIAFVAVFGFFTALTMVQALNKESALAKHLRSPIEIEIPEDFNK